MPSTIWNDHATRGGHRLVGWGFVILAAVAALAGVPAGAPAYGSPVPMRGVMPTPPGGEAHPDQPRFDLRFAGGTVAEYLEAIQKASGRRNIVSMAGTDQVSMPPVALDGVNTLAAVSVLDGMSVETNAGEPRTISVSMRHDVITVSVRTDRNVMWSPVQRATVSRSTAVHGLAEMLLNGAYTIDAILSAIDVALDLSGDSDAKVRYHEETRMLFVHGTGLEHATVRNVLEELSIQATMMPREEMSEEERLKQEIMVLDGQIEGELQSLRHLSTRARPMLGDRIAVIRSEIATLEAKVSAGEGTVATNEEIALQYRALERVLIEQEQLDTRMRHSQMRLEHMREERSALQKKLSGESGS